jgi:hypothetical protein
VKQVFWFMCAIILSALTTGAVSSVVAQTASPTPDPFIAQLTSTPNAAFNSVLGDFSANGRFAVFISNGNVATEQTDTRNNKDGNRELFLIDYGQRRIFQITNTKNVPNPSASPTPTPSPSPTPTPGPTPADRSLVKIEIENRSPMISLAPALVNGKRTYTIVFSSNAPDPANFDGTEGGLATDGNSEIWIYQLPAVSDVDLTLGADLPLQDLAAGTFFQVTNTPASRVPSAGSATAAPFFADDNRECTISDDGKILAFISTRNLVPEVGNADFNPELFLYTIASGTLTQGTKTQDAVLGIGFIFNSNPSLSADGSIVAFTSSANLATNNADLNAEIYMANFSGGAVSNIFQVTRTQGDTTNVSVNVGSPGRRLSRNGAQIAFESRATDPKANSTTNSQFLGTFVYTRASDSFVEVGPRANATTGSDIGRFPSFTDYNASLEPSSLVFASFLNFRPDGTIPATAQASEGLNPQRSAQIFITSLPASSSNTFTRLTNTPVVATFGGTRPMPAETRKRMIFALGGAEFGTGNADGSIEVYYLLTPQITTTSSAVLSFFTGASEMPVAAATPLPSPAPSPTPTPSPVPGAPAGLAAGELSIVRSTIPLAPASARACPPSPLPCASETARSPALPIELNGVSVSVNGAAAGVYFVGASEKQINFVMPVAVPAGLGIVAVNILDSGANTDTFVRGQVQIVPGQPDIFSVAGRASAQNITIPTARTDEPFNVTTVVNGAPVPTVIGLDVTGLRNAALSEISVTVGTTAIPAAQILAIQPNTNMPGWDFISFSLPNTLAGAGDVPVVVTFTRSGFSATSRPADTAPKIHIN